MTQQAPKAPKGRPIALNAPYGDLARAVGGMGTLSAMLGVSARTIRDWSNGRTKPEGPARLLLDRVLAEQGLH